MPDQIFRCPGPLEVQVIDGPAVIAFIDLNEGRIALGMSEADADETGRRLREAARLDDPLPVPSGQIAKVTIRPPHSPEESADLHLEMFSGATITLTLPWGALVALSDTAQAALAAVAPSGRG